ncbi:(3,5-dihydroxyphenyl)acetyl-CoA 1,2-dioxygenase DpgC, partial [Lentzea sp. NPDC060358]|uniref:(3,5-dihydroxyphenyl)acetyl-CoA 1,2-dioxygenase DpgC n=1 Tax=Lentzea sp. NPDC060358 TaxID=3347103 RepID=UPI00364F8958
VHADRVHARLTGGAAVPLRPAELVEAAAREYPGLVPTAAQLDEELRHLQADKEGREVDQGIFFQALLRAPGPGRHVVESALRPTSRALGLLADYATLGSLDLGTVSIDRRDGIAHVTLRNTDCLNAEDNALVADLETAVDLVALDDSTGAGVLRGAHMTHPRYAGRRVFSAGINLKELHRGRISYVDFLLGRELGLVHKLSRGVLLEQTEHTWPRGPVTKPWLGAVDTFAIGGGMQLTLALDRVLAAADSYLSLPAAREGIVPGFGNLRLRRLAGGRLARQIVLQGRKIAATDPEAALFCDAVLDPDALDAAVDRDAALLDDPAVAANRRMLVTAEEPLDAFREYAAEFALVQALRLHSEDVLTKVGRFTAKPAGPPR